MKCTIFADSGATAPGAVLGSATPLVNPATGANTLTFGTPVAVSKGVTATGFGVSHDVTAVLSQVREQWQDYTAVSYAAFPGDPPAVTSSQLPIASTVTIANAEL
jgi:hypothetical protein